MLVFLPFGTVRGQQFSPTVEWSAPTVTAAIVLIGLLFLLLLGIILYLINNNRQRRRIEKQLRESEERLTYAVSSSDEAVWDWRIDSGEVIFNAGFSEMLGFEEKDIEPTLDGWRALLHPDEVDDVNLAIERHVAGQTVNYRIEHRFRTHSGNWKWVLARGKVVARTEDGRPLRMVGTYSDVNDQHQIEDTVRSLMTASADSVKGDFFERLVLNISATMGLKLVFIGRLTGVDDRSVQTIGVCVDGKLAENFSYSLEGTPCAEVIAARHARSIPDAASEVFPHQHLLNVLGVKGYLGVPIPGGDGKPLGLIVGATGHPLENGRVAIDTLQIIAARLTSRFERGSYEKALKKSELLWQFALEGTGDGVWDWDLITGEVYYSRTYREMLGYSEAEYPNRLESWMTHIHPEDISYVMSEHERHIQGETESIYVEYRLKCKEGYYKWLLGRGKVVERREDGTALRLVGTNTEITMRKASEQVLHDTMVKYQSLFVSMSEGFAFHQVHLNDRQEPVDYTILDVNPAYSAILGIPREKAIGQLASVVYGTGTPPFLEEFSRVAMTGVAEHVEIYFDAMDKYFNVGVFSPEHGRFATIFSDVTDRRRSEGVLARERNLLRTVVDNIPDAIFVKDSNFRRTLSNKTDVALIGARSEAEVLGKMDGDLWPADLAAVFSDLDRYVFETGLPILNREIAFQPVGSKQTHWLVSSRIPLFDEDGKVTGLVAIGRDITERKLSEQEIRRLNAELEDRVQERTAQLEATVHELEAFSYSVSHDLRAPLRSIDGFSRAMLEDCADQLDETGVSHLKRIRISSQRMSDLINDLLMLSRITRTTLSRGTVDFSAMASDVSSVIAATAPARVVNWSIEPGIIINADASLMRIVLENLLGNAWKFTQKHETARISVAKALIDGSTVYYIQDDGAGFDMKYAHNLFAPFQRMHSTSEFDGTGIGLATVQRIIHRHGGTVWVESAIEQGTTVYFTLD
jgi:PAS domain S-box-containing protein